MPAGDSGDGLEAPPRRGPSGPDWAELRQAADSAASRAYAPYSGLHVGAAGLCENGHVVTGTNVENASYGLTTCAEASLVSALVASGCRRLIAVSVTAGDGRPLSPCGGCRQRLMEHGGAELLVDGGPDASPQRLEALLPDAFAAADIAKRRKGSSARPAGEPGRTGGGRTGDSDTGAGHTGDSHTGAGSTGGSR
jgi:cytidine deaminase